MRYISTRGSVPPVSFLTAVEQGLAADGGLYLPESLPDISAEVRGPWRGLPYPELATRFFSLFATDLPEEELRQVIARSYATFDHPEIAPVRFLDEQTAVLELFHGPTLAFKDFALQVLGNLYELQIRRTGRPISVLGATSGDTGAAAIHGLLGKEGVRTFILYPNGRVSPLQERQMTTTGADNVFALAIDGTFDDAQAALKDVFGDGDFAREVGLSAVNSINLARILAQAIYYVHAWMQLPPKLQEEAIFVVPTGNFGNVLAGWLARRMGLPIRGFRIAVNRNDILHRLFSTGEYRVDSVSPSLAPSMDIQVASNFERFLYYLENGDPARVRSIMHTFKKDRAYHFPGFDCPEFSSSRTGDDTIPGIIRHVHDRYQYIIDPHTACGFDGPADEARVVLATAHPAKFPDTIGKALGTEPTHPTLEALKSRPISNHPLQPTPEAIKGFIRSH